MKKKSRVFISNERQQQRKFICSTYLLHAFIYHRANKGSHISFFPSPFRCCQYLLWNIVIHNNFFFFITSACLVIWARVQSNWTIDWISRIKVHSSHILPSFAYPTTLFEFIGYIILNIERALLSNYIVIFCQ